MYLIFEIDLCINTWTGILNGNCGLPGVNFICTMCKRLYYEGCRSKDPCCMFVYTSIVFEGAEWQVFALQAGLILEDNFEDQCHAWNSSILVSANRRLYTDDKSKRGIVTYYVGTFLWIHKFN